AESSTVQVRAEAQSLTPFHHLEVIANGETAAAAPATEPTGSSPATAVVETDLELPAGSWLAALCVGKHPTDVVAHTSPVYVERRPAAVPSPAIEAAERRLQGYLDRAVDWVLRRAHFARQRRRGSVPGILNRP